VSVPPVRVTGLPTIPAGALARDDSFLLALGGCIGGPGVTDASERSVCGERYTQNTPTLAPYLAKLSRITREGRIGLQFMAASPALLQSDLVILPAGRDAVVLAEGVPVGGLRPARADVGASAPDLLVADPGSRVRVFAAGAAEAAYDEPWEITLSAGGLAGLDPGKTYTLVQIGPYPGFARRSFWNDPRVTVVEN
jgi:hypothetical protein